MRQQPYNKEDIVYPNLVIESFTVDKLITYFDQFDTSISNGLLVESEAEAEKTLIKIRQYRLNHKPFNFHMAINAANPMKASIRIFLGPKYDSHHKLTELPENLKDFYEIDSWIVDCKYFIFHYILYILHILYFTIYTTTLYHLLTDYIKQKRNINLIFPFS